eukprot:14308154-Ditylum_brightwellii.AAC.1
MLMLAAVGMQRIAVIFSWWRKDGLLETNMSMQRGSSGGSAMVIARRFDYALGLTSQSKINVFYSEVAFPGLKP